MSVVYSAVQVALETRLDCIINMQPVTYSNATWSVPDACDAIVQLSVYEHNHRSSAGWGSSVQGALVNLSLLTLSQIVHAIRITAQVVGHKFLFDCGGRVGFALTCRRWLS